MLLVLFYCQMDKRLVQKKRHLISNREFEVCVVHHHNETSTSFFLACLVLGYGGYKLLPCIHVWRLVKAWLHETPLAKQLLTAAAGARGAEHGGATQQSDIQMVYGLGLHRVL